MLDGLARPSLHGQELRVELAFPQRVPVLEPGTTDSNKTYGRILSLALLFCKLNL